MQPDSKHGIASGKVDDDHAAFFRAVHGGDLAFLEIFLAKNPGAAKWNTPDGTPPLVLAIGADDRDLWAPESPSYSHGEVINLLITYGADVNAKDVQGRSALLEECRHDQREEVIEALLAHGADINAVDNLKTGVLHLFATRDYNEEIITTLAKKGADVNARDWLGNTPLHIAAGESGFEFTSGHLDAVRRLLDAGASLEIRNNSMRTPLDTANMNGDFAEDGKRPTADLIQGIIGARPKPRVPRTTPSNDDEQEAGVKKPGPSLTPPPNGRFKLKPPSP